MGAKVELNKEAVAKLVDDPLFGKTVDEHAQKVMERANYPKNEMTKLTLASYADTDFIRWVDWASRFVQMLEASPLNGEEKSIVKRVLNMKAVG